LLIMLSFSVERTAGIFDWRWPAVHLKVLLMPISKRLCHSFWFSGSSFPMASIRVITHCWLSWWLLVFWKVLAAGTICISCVRRAVRLRIWDWKD
jgi:hypothetical protein